MRAEGQGLWTVKGWAEKDDGVFTLGFSPRRRTIKGEEKVYCQCESDLTWMRKQVCGYAGYRYYRNWSGHETSNAAQGRATHTHTNIHTHTVTHVHTHTYTFINLYRSTDGTTDRLKLLLHLDFNNDHCNYALPLRGVMKLSFAPSRPLASFVSFLSTSQAPSCRVSCKNRCFSLEMVVLDDWN